jgi:hypothetical protein
MRNIGIYPAAAQLRLGGVAANSKAAACRVRVVRDCSIKRKAIYVHQQAISDIMLGGACASEFIERAEATIRALSDRTDQDCEFARR